MNSQGPIIVKVGGSLFDLPDLGQRLQKCFRNLGGSDRLIVPGGGPTVDQVRTWDCRFNLGTEISHWLALRAMQLNAWFLAGLLEEVSVVQTMGDLLKPWAPSSGKASRVRIVDMYSWVLEDEKNPDHLPHTWEITSDSLSVRLAIQVKASQLVLLKSVDVPEGEWVKAASAGFVDAFFPQLIIQAGTVLRTRVVNLRTE